MNTKNRKTPEQIEQEASDHAKRVVALKWASPKCEKAIAGAWEAGYIMGLVDSSTESTPSVSDAVEFAEWVIDKKWNRSFHMNTYGNWYLGDDPTLATITTTELYAEFKKQSPQPVIENNAVEVLRELVALKDMKDNFPSSKSNQLKLRQDYLRRKPLAWEAARKLLQSNSSVTVEKGRSTNNEPGEYNTM